MTIQIRNAEMIELLRPDFFARYEPNASLVHTGLHMQLPQLRGYWPMSSVDENGAVYDMSGQGRMLTNTNTVAFGTYNLLPYSDYTPASTHYLNRLDEPGLDITGALTMGGWFSLDTVASGANQVLMGKYNTVGNQRAYQLYLVDASDQFVFIVSSNGAATTTVTNVPVAVISTWYHIVGRYVPGAELSIFVDGVETLNVAAIPAAIFNSTAKFTIGARDPGTEYLDGKSAQCFLCADDLDDVVIKTIFDQTRANYGK